MEIRKPAFTEDGRIDCDIKHPIFGWIPFTASKDDPEELGRKVFAAALAMGPAAHVPEPEPDPLEAERAGMIVSRFQAKAALYQAGILGQIEELLNSSENFIHRLAWQEAVEFRRDSPTIQFLSEEMGLSPEALDDLFRAAMTIRA